MLKTPRHDHGTHIHSAAEKRHQTHVALQNRTIFISWKPEYEMGVLILDEQHRGIVAAINSLHFAMQHGEGDGMLAHVVGMVTEYAKIHFHTEEEFHEKCGFPDNEEHKTLHKQLLTETLSTGRLSMENRDPKMFLHFMREWWVDHICGADMEFKKHLTAMN